MENTYLCNFKHLFYKIIRLQELIIAWNRQLMRM
jgi:hypothetical protein